MKPEEIVRQSLLLEMTQKFSFPRELIGIEKEISLLPHLRGQKVPKRRFDIICFSNEIEKQIPLYPLLLVECKADKLSEDALSQVLGYNYYVGSYFVAIASKDGILIFDRKGEFISNGLIDYKKLICYGMDLQSKSISCI